MNYLAIDTTTKYLTVQVNKNGHLDSYTSTKPLEHSIALMPTIEKMLGAERLSGLDAIAINVGVGSFTGIRIGITTAKTLAMVGNLPLIPYNSFQLRAVNTTKDYKDNLTIVIDGGNKTYYIGVIDKNYNLINKPIIIPHKDLMYFLSTFEGPHQIAGDIQIVPNNYELININEQLDISLVLNKCNISPVEYSKVQPMYAQLSQAEKSKLN